MRSLVETIDKTLSNIGRTPRDLLFETVIAFDNLELSDEEEICAVASAIAANAAGRYRRRVDNYLDAVRIWAVEMAVEAGSPPPRLYRLPITHRIEAGAALLLDGTIDLVEALADAAASVQDRMVAELTLYAKLLGRHDVNTIHLALDRVAEATAAMNFKPGQVLALPLRETHVMRRTDRLEDVVMRGTA
jgi:hypothetical protein